MSSSSTDSTEYFTKFSEGAFLYGLGTYPVAHLFVEKTAEQLDKLYIPPSLKTRFKIAGATGLTVGLQLCAKKFIEGQIFDNNEPLTMQKEFISSTLSGLVVAPLYAGLNQILDRSPITSTNIRTSYLAALGLREGTFVFSVASGRYLQAEVTPYLSKDLADSSIVACISSVVSGFIGSVLFHPLDTLQVWCSSKNHKIEWNKNLYKGFGRRVKAVTLLSITTKVIELQILSTIQKTAKDLNSIS